jgi:hypothetical protein
MLLAPTLPLPTPAARFCINISPFVSDLGEMSHLGRDGGGCRTYYKALARNPFHNFDVMNFVDSNGIKRVVLLYNELEELWTSY